MKSILSTKQYADLVAYDGRHLPADYSLVPVANYHKRLVEVDTTGVLRAPTAYRNGKVLDGFTEQVGLCARVTDKKKKRGEIVMYGTIGMDWFGDGITAKSFGAELKALGDVDNIDLRINSEGGSVHDGRAIYNLLVNHKAKVDVHIDGLAASAASFVAMAGDTITIAESGFLMIHNASMMARGTAEDFEAVARFLHTVNRTIADTYVVRTGQKASKIKEWMDAETWFTGQEALDAGFATDIVKNKSKDEASAFAISPLMGYQHVPKAFRKNRVEALALMKGD